MKTVAVLATVSLQKCALYVNLNTCARDERSLHICFKPISNVCLERERRSRPRSIFPDVWLAGKQGAVIHGATQPIARLLRQQLTSRAPQTC